MLTLLRIVPAIDDPRVPGGSLPIPNSATSLCRLATGRSALLHLLNRLPRPHASTVLLPCYVAEGVIQPFLNAGFTVLFYRLGPELSPLVDDVDALLGGVNGTAVFVLIHYFGFPARSEGLSRMLSRHGPVIVEDCAHALFTTGQDGRALAEDAQLCLYSLNKFLPVVDGAILISNRPDIDLALAEDELPELPEEAQRAYREHLEAGRALFESHDPALAGNLLVELGRAYERYYGWINADLSPCRQSAGSRAIEESFPFDHLVQQRRLNSKVLYEELTSPVLSLLHPVLPAGCVPFCIPARVPAGLRADIIDRMLDHGVLLSTLQGKWDFVPPELHARFEVETAFLNEHVLLPVSEFITADSVRDMVRQLNSI